MVTAATAVDVLRHVLREHGEGQVRLGGGLPSDGPRWLGGLLGWQWPDGYLSVLVECDGGRLGSVTLCSFGESLRAMIPPPDRWRVPQGYWPVAVDEDENSWWALAMSEARADGECPVVVFSTRLK